MFSFAPGKYKVMVRWWGVDGGAETDMLFFPRGSALTTPTTSSAT